MTKQALCFDYSELMGNYGINLNVDTGVSIEDDPGGSDEGPYKF